MNSTLRQRGATMIEILVTIVVIAFGLLGMAGLQVRMQMSEMESYQRSQALLLAEDMANRIAANRLDAASYVTGTTTPYGEGMTCATTTSSSTIAQKDLSEWCNALQGASEVSGTTKQGAALGARGCVEAVDGDYMVTVAWQGLTPISAPPSSVACGNGSYNTGTSCISERCRRVVTTLVRIATLI